MLIVSDKNNTIDILNRLNICNTVIDDDYDIKMTFKVKK